MYSIVKYKGIPEIWKPEYKDQLMHLGGNYSVTGEEFKTMTEAKCYLKMKIEVNNETLNDLKVVTFNKFISDKYLISYHFFNSEGLEVAYFNTDMVSLCGLQILEQPRKWSQSILNDQTEMQDIKHYVWEY